MALEVNPADLRDAGAAVVVVADASHGDAGALSGSAGANAASAAGFASMTAAVRLEDDWQGTIDAIAAKLASAGDNLDLSAASYASTEASNKNLFPVI